MPGFMIGIGAAQIDADAVGTSEIATDGVGTAEIAAGAVATAELADGALAASAAGRLKMATSFFDSEATVDDKFAAATIDTDRLTVAARSRMHVMDIEDLGAGADITDRVIMSPQFAGTITDIRVWGNGAAAGIDAGNTSVWLVELNGTAQIAAKTYDNATVFPASGVPDSLGALTNATFAANDEITLTITNGATADLPGCKIQITYRIN